MGRKQGEYWEHFLFHDSDITSQSVTTGLAHLFKIAPKLNQYLMNSKDWEHGFLHIDHP
jgi:hypothetical protein